jgi:hypothetical protein
VTRLLEASSYGSRSAGAHTNHKSTVQIRMPAPNYTHKSAPAGVASVRRLKAGWPYYHAKALVACLSIEKFLRSSRAVISAIALL